MVTMATQLPCISKTKDISETFHTDKRSICHYLLYFYANPDFQYVGETFDVIMID